MEGRCRGSARPGHVGIVTKRRRASVHVLIVDRWHDADTASAELDGAAGVLVPRALLPDGAHPDVVMRVERRAARVTIAIDVDATDAARRESQELTARLKRRDPGGNVTL